MNLLFTIYHFSLIFPDINIDSIIEKFSDLYRTSNRKHTDSIKKATRWKSHFLRITDYLLTKNYCFVLCKKKKLSKKENKTIELTVNFLNWLTHQRIKNMEIRVLVSVIQIFIVIKKITENYSRLVKNYSELSKKRD